MAGRGRGQALFKKLAEMQVEDEEEEQQAAAPLRQMDTDLTSIAPDSEIDRRFQQMENFYRPRCGDSEQYETSTADPSIGTETFVAPFRTYIAKVRGEDSASDPTAPTSTVPDSEQTTPKLNFLGRGRGMFSVATSSLRPGNEAAGNLLYSTNKHGNNSLVICSLNIRL